LFLPKELIIIHNFAEMAAAVAFNPKWAAHILASFSASRATLSLWTLTSTCALTTSPPPPAGVTTASVLNYL